MLTAFIIGVLALVAPLIGSFPLDRAVDAGAVAHELKMILPSESISHNQETNTISVQGSAEQLRQAAKLIRDLSETYTQQRPVRFILLRAEAAKVAVRLTALLQGDCKITSDKATNTVYLRGTPEQVRRATWIVKRLDKPLFPGVVIVRLQTGDSSQLTAIVKWVMLLLSLFTFGDDEFHALPASVGANKSIILSGYPESIAKAQTIIRVLDGKPK